MSDPAGLVNPFVGTGNIDGATQSAGAIGTARWGDTFPGAAYPFGMVQWSPDTWPDRHPGGGYAYQDSAISGFSMTHFSGSGCQRGGDLPFLPMTGRIPSEPSSKTEPFTHASESAAPGFYSVRTGLVPVTTALSVTARTGMGQFTYAPGAAADLLVKLAGGVVPASATSVTFSKSSIVGQTTVSTGTCGPTRYTISFAVQFDHTFAGDGTWSQAGVHGPGGAWLRFAMDGSRTLLARVGISFVSIPDALANLSAEEPNWSFARVRADATQAWNGQLSKIAIGGGTARSEAIFYTELYHCLLFPSLFSDVNGDYMGIDGLVHRAPSGHSHYTNVSGWDVYRTEVPLLSMLDPSVVSDVVTSLVDDASQANGQLPQWLAYASEPNTMDGDPTDIIIADALAFGAGAFNHASAWNAMWHQATVPGPGRPYLGDYERLGYVSAQDLPYSVSETLEYGAADAALARYATATGRQSQGAELAARSVRAWQSLYDPSTGLVAPKLADGAWQPGSSATNMLGDLEGDASQYTFMVPYDIPGLAAAIGGDAAFATRLTAYFSQLNAGRYAREAWMGNEPSLPDPFEPALAGDPSLTQLTARRVMTLYQDSPNGLPGNDDLGAMSSSQVFSAIGLYPEIGGSAQLEISTPLFPEAIVHLGNGNGNGSVIDEHAPGATFATTYTSAVSLDGSPVTVPLMPGRLVTAGGSLQFTVSTEPATPAARLASPGAK